MTAGDLRASLADRLAHVRERIHAAERAAGRPPGSVTLVCVSKGHPPAAIREAYDAGARLFGESYASELVEKARALEDLADLAFHFIGHLQTNKAKLVVPLVKMVHAVDSPSLVPALAKRVAAGERLDVLAQVNVAGETQKSGVAPSALSSLLDAIDAEPLLRLRGLMTIPPDDPSSAAAIFASLRDLREEHGGTKRLPELSMGMSGDLDAAVAEGATMVRIGTAVFGARAR